MSTPFSLKTQCFGRYGSTTVHRPNGFRPSSRPWKYSNSSSNEYLTFVSISNQHLARTSRTVVFRADTSVPPSTAVLALPCTPSRCYICHQSRRQLACSMRLYATSGQRAGSGRGPRGNSTSRTGKSHGTTGDIGEDLGDVSGPIELHAEFSPGDIKAAVRRSGASRDRHQDRRVDHEGDGPISDDDHGAEAVEEEEEEEKGEEEDDGVSILARSVVQVRTQHRVPNFSRPWEEGHDAESSSSGFVVAAEVVPEPGKPPRRQLLVITTAGAVEFARKVEVCRAADDATPYVASVAAVCLDLDVALLHVNDPAFWGQCDDNGSSSSRSSSRGGRGAARGSRKGKRGQYVSHADASDDDEDKDDGEGSRSDGGTTLVPLQLDTALPHLRKPVVVAGFPLGGGNLCVTSGVVSRIEVLEYSHSGRALLALQVDAPLNNGGWGGPALCPSSGRCVGMAFQKFTSQTWMERYDDVASEMYQGDGDEEEGEGGDAEEGHDGGGDSDGGGGAPGQEYDEDAENIGYLVPAQLLQLVLEDYSLRRKSHQLASTSTSSAKSHSTPATARGSSSGSGRGAKRGGGTARGVGAGGGGLDSETRGSAPLHLDGRPRLGLRYQRMESPALRRWLGLTAGESGVLVTGVDPTGSAAGVVQVHDVLLAVGSRQVANDGTTLLRPGQRVLFGHWSAVANVGDEITLKVLRGKARLELSVRLRGSGDSFLPVSLGPSRRPQYLVVGPLVFIAFSLPLWYELIWAQRQVTEPAARRAIHAGIVPVMGAMEWGLPAEDDGEEVVMLTEVLSYGEELDEAAKDLQDEQQTSTGNINASSSGSHAAADETGGGRGGGVAGEVTAWSGLLRCPGRLATFNGQRVRSLAQLASAVVAASAAAEGGGEQQQFLRFCTEPAGSSDQRSSSSNSGSSSSGDGGSEDGDAAAANDARVGACLVVLDAARLAADTRAVLKHHGLAAAMSADLRRRLSTQWPFEAGHQDNAASRQRRQQGRRVALSGRR